MLSRIVQLSSQQNFAPLSRKIFPQQHALPGPYGVPSASSAGQHPVNILLLTEPFKIIIPNYFITRDYYMKLYYLFPENLLEQAVIVIKN